MHTGQLARLKQRKFSEAFAPYSYLPAPADNGHYIFDPETTLTVKLIYDLALDSRGRLKTDKQLFESKIPITTPELQNLT